MFGRLRPAVGHTGPGCGWGGGPSSPLAGWLLGAGVGTSDENGCAVMGGCPPTRWAKNGPLQHASFRGTDGLSFSRLSKRLVRSFRMRDHGQTRSPGLLLEFATSVAQTPAHATGCLMAHPPDIARRPASSRRVAPARPPSFSGRASVPMPSLRRRRDRRQQYSTESDEADRLMTQ